MSILDSYLEVDGQSDLLEEMDAAELIVRYLEQIGVEYVFGVPGGAIEPIYNALARSARRGGPRPVLACHEAGAAYMADGYMRETGKLGVCISTSGPGATNLITGVACAYENNIPLLVISGQPALPSFGKGALQESACTGVNVVGMFSKCTRYNSLVSHSSQLETKLVNAILRAHQNPRGPAHLSVPVDILRSQIPNTQPRYNLATQLNRRTSDIDKIAVRELEKDLEQAKHPVFFIGAGASEAIESIMQLVNLTDAKFITTSDAKGLINPRHKAYRGVFGFGGHDSAEKELREYADLVVAMGTGFGELSSAGWCDSVMNDRLIHIDPSEENLMRSPMAKLHVHGQINTVCGYLIRHFLSICPEKVFVPDSIHNEAFNPDVSFQSLEKIHSDEGPIKPQRLMMELSERFPPNTRFLADTGNSMIWAAHYLQPKCRRVAPAYQPNRVGASSKNPVEKRSGNASWLRLTLDFATMGWAIGAAVGMARGNPNCPVVSITGDGSYLMSGQEITIAAEEKLPVVFVILNDSAFGMVMHGQRLSGAEKIAYKLRTVDFKKMAEAMGVQGHIIESPKDFDEIDFDQILNHDGPTLLDVRIDREEVPPMMLRLKTLGSVDN